jgi:phosphoribosyl 1,2-cyclic phosphodiesterase
MPEQLVDAKPGTEFNIQNLHVTATQAKHTDPNAVGFKIETATLGHIAYTSDSEYFTGIGTQYSGARILILCVLRPTGSPWKGHMTTDDAIKIVEETKPEMTVLTHFGMQMIVKDPDKEARILQQQTGVPAVAAKDEMHIKIAEKIRIQAAGKREGLEDFL